MQDSFLRLIGVLGASAGAYLYVSGRELLGLAVVVLGLAAVLKTTRLAYRVFGPWRPSTTDLGLDRAEREELKQRAKERLKNAAALGPGARRSHVADATAPGRVEPRDDSGPATADRSSGSGS